ncbi:MAG TPA: OmpA family protein [Chitinophagaceae bacterium]
MASKKYLLLAGAFSLLVSSSVFSQDASAQTSTTTQSTPTGWKNQDMTYRGGSYDYLDTAYIPASRLAQQRSFMSNESIYPAKPRDMWELGIGGGYYGFFSSVPGRPGWAADVSLRKALGYTFSVRGQFTYGNAKGLDYRLSSWPAANASPAYNGYPSMAGQSFVRNYKSTTYAGSLDVLASLNNILFHKAQTKVDFYLLGGYTLLGYKTETDIFSSGTTPYDFSGVNFSGKRKDIISAVKNVLKGNYVAAPNERRTPNNNNADNNFWWRHSLDAGAGVEFKVSKHFNIGVEQKFTLPFDPWITGYALNGSDYVKDPVISYTSVHLNFNLGNAAKRVEPLWWLNPLDYAYSELNAPRHMKLPTPVLPDADGDGVTDQFDKCPNTPAGVAVDVHGCPLDTDGDGVPDYKDKQLITPTYCQPVDADGVGKCPCPDSTCYAGLSRAAACNLGTLPSITFKGRSARVSTNQQALLADVANRMRQNPDCKVVVTGHAEASKASEQLSWDRVNAVITYLTEKEGISGDRFIFQYSGVPGDIHSVDLRTATDADQGPNTVPPPHPNLRHK